ncbi:L,D-transpeptidase family protein [Ensifer sesbaniae]|uniref:L,D-transpeptidase family protein n=1 Tax=Ensifer sesbaniae TaxID=1214071 RepID=UPI001568A6A0|nr:L,D-transpeptidase [Ensifer sesbaniae]NRQ16558.1 putative L,D-transpeptidase YkuD [Ensifer sesbaniae]
MKTVILSTVLLLLLPAGLGTAQTLQPDSINSASITPSLLERMTTVSDRPDPAIVRLQVLLDRAGASPGVIDGYGGENVVKAVAAFRTMRDLPADGRLDPDLLERLSKQTPVVQPYVISGDDAKGLVAKMPNDYSEQAKMNHLGYTSVVERLAERFHMDIDLLRALNATSTFSVGETVSVVIPGAPRQGMVKRIEAHRRTGQLMAFGADGTLIAAYPATIGSRETPPPSGTHKVKGVARMPPYIYNPKINFQQSDNREVLTLPAGPNNPVGSVWIDLSKPTYGIHGTPEPSLIDKAGSHGCVRLTNWDAEELAAMVEPGVIVEFVD